jgi:hypothetical protein
MARYYGKTEQYHIKCGENMLDITNTLYYNIDRTEAILGDTFNDYD